MGDDKNWVKKYFPESLSEIQGQDSALESAKREIENFRNKKKAILLHGPSGTGKSAFVYAYAKSKNLEVIELNASDFRNKKALDEILSQALKQGSLFHKGKIILLDEIDGISGRHDRGGISYISKIIPKSNYPIVITGNDVFDSKFTSLRKKSVLIQFHSLNYRSIKTILEKICEKEGLKYEESAVSSLARMAGGDARAAINDLQILSASGKKVTSDLVKELAPRDTTEKIFDALRRVLKTTSLENSLGAFDAVEEKYDKVLLWLDKNIPFEYKKPEDVLRAYEALSNADVFSSRIIRRQYWRLLVYMYFEMSVGVSLAKDEKYRGFTKYQSPDRILKMWIYKQKLNKINDISKQIAEHYFISSNEAKHALLPFLSVVFNAKTKKGKEMADSITKELKLDKPQVEAIKKISKKSGNI
jgi:replication factor C large subunit